MENSEITSIIVMLGQKMVVLFIQLQPLVIIEAYKFVARKFSLMGENFWKMFCLSHSEFLILFFFCLT